MPTCGIQPASSPLPLPLSPFRRPQTFTPLCVMQLQPPTSQAINQPADPRPLLQAIVGVFSDIHMFLGACTQSHYTTSCGSVFSHATIGGHIRHCIDHLAAFHAAMDHESAQLASSELSSPIVDYETRSRGTPVEFNTQVAASEIARHMEKLSTLELSNRAQTLRICVLSLPFTPVQHVDSTPMRELAYLLSHTIHHQATIRAMAVHLGMDVSPTFGLAPSTLQHTQQAQQAPYSTSAHQTPPMQSLQVTPRAAACAP